MKESREIQVYSLPEERETQAIISQYKLKDGLPHRAQQALAEKYN